MGSSRMMGAMECQQHESMCVLVEAVMSAWYVRRASERGHFSVKSCAAHFHSPGTEEVLMYHKRPALCFCLCA